MQVDQRNLSAFGDVSEAMVLCSVVYAYQNGLFNEFQPRIWREHQYDPRTDVDGFGRMAGKNPATMDEARAYPWKMAFRRHESQRPRNQRQFVTLLWRAAGSPGSHT
jgi:hypothetical protein